MRVDLDAARAARAEADGEAREFVLGGEVFALPAEIPWETSERFTAGDVMGGLVILLGPEQSERLRSVGPSVQDIEALAGAIGELYGISQGESQASAGS
jgi:hypothetical protein